ncbi:Frigida domain-containing protein, partial [Cephalotus follicularis]
ASLDSLKKREVTIDGSVQITVEIVERKVLPMDKRASKVNDLFWACVLILENLISVVVDSIICRSRLLVTPTVKVDGKEIAEAWKASLEENGVLCV